MRLEWEARTLQPDQNQLVSRPNYQPNIPNLGRAITPIPEKPGVPATSIPYTLTPSVLGTYLSIHFRHHTIFRAEHNPHPSKLAYTRRH
jgi:hypothetical protein